MDVKATLLNSIEEVLDKMAFMFFDQGTEGPDEPDEFPHVTQVVFKGVIVGSLNIFVSETAARQIARNLIGIRPNDELHEGTLEDALREFTNMVMGRTMTLLAPDGPFDMEVPELVQAAAPPAPGSNLLRVDGTLDDEPFRLVLQYRESVN